MQWYEGGWGDEKKSLSKVETWMKKNGSHTMIWRKSIPHSEMAGTRSKVTMGTRCQKGGKERQSKETTLRHAWSWQIWSAFFSVTTLPFVLHVSHSCVLIFLLIFQASLSLRTVRWLFSLHGMLFHSYLPVQLSLSFKSLLSFHHSTRPTLTILFRTLSH